MGLFDFFRKGGPSGAEAEARVQMLIGQLGDPSAAVRLKACEDLRDLGRLAAAACPRLQELIDDEDGDVCLASAAALSEIERGL